MGTIGISTRVYARNSFGRFISELERAATETVAATVEEGTALAKGMATVKTGAMRASIEGYMTSATSGEWMVGTDHWHFQEHGTAPHPITGRVSFWWEKEGRPWFAGNNTISHPGNPAVHFMLNSYRIAGGHMMDYARRFYPG